MAATQIMLWTGVLLSVSGPAVAGEVEHLRTVSSSVAIDVGRAVGDVVVVDGPLSIDGVVRGHVFAVDSAVELGDHAVVMGSVTVHRGSLTIRPGAALPETIYLHGARFAGPNGEKLRPGQTLKLGTAEVSVASTAASTASVELMKWVLPFERFVPRAGLTAKDLDGWHPEEGLELRRIVASPRELTVGGIARLTFVSDKVRGAFQRGYRGPAGTVLITAVQLQDAPTAEALWQQVESAGRRVKLRLSVKTGLGDGAHWFFKRRNRYCMMWQRSSWLFAVETRLSNRDARLFPQAQFSERVLDSLQRQLSQSSALSRGVQP